MPAKEQRNGGVLQSPYWSTWHAVWRLIGKQYYDSASRSHDLSGTVSGAALQEIERQVRQFEHAVEAGAIRPTMEDMVVECLAAGRTDDLVPLRIRADLYLSRTNGEELFFEIKSPQPNKGQCLEVTQRLLRVYLLNAHKRSQTKALFAMAYNPFGPTRNEYKWSFATNYTPFDEMIIIGNEFWTLVGGDTAFEELLEIYQEVGRDKTKYMLDSLAFGF